jgi:hypothetical protein
MRAENGTAKFSISYILVNRLSQDDKLPEVASCKLLHGSAAYILLTRFIYYI